MKTSSKLRRLQRIRKLRKQRRTFFLILMVTFVMVAHSAFSESDVSDSKYSITSVTIQPGDTLWSIAKEYKPADKNLADFVYEIAESNGVADCNIVCGQTLYVPISNN